MRKIGGVLILMLSTCSVAMEAPDDGNQGANPGPRGHLFRLGRGEITVSTDILGKRVSAKYKYSTNGGGTTITCVSFEPANGSCVVMMKEGPSKKLKVGETYSVAAGTPYCVTYDLSSILPFDAHKCTPE